MFFKTAHKIIRKVVVLGNGCCREVICILKQHIRISEKGWL